MAKVQISDNGDHKAKWGVIEWVASCALCGVMGVGGGMLSAKDAKQDERLSIVETRQAINEELLGEVRQIVPLMQRVSVQLESVQTQIDDIKETVKRSP